MMIPSTTAVSNVEERDDTRSEGVDWEHLTSSRPISHLASSRPANYEAAAIAVAAEVRRAIMAVAGSFSAANVYSANQHQAAEIFLSCAALTQAWKPGAVSAALQRLRTFRDWEGNWDAEGAAPPDRAAIDAASNLLGFLKSYPIEPVAMLAATGAPMLLVRYGGGEGEITISGDGAIDFVLDLPGGETEAEVDIPFDSLTIPAQLHDILSQLNMPNRHER